MSNVHFVAALEYKKRIIQLGEHPSRVYNFGALGVENIKKTKIIPDYINVGGGFPTIYPLNSSQLNGIFWWN
mgnify:CR=1 FL=1